ncbi:MAG: preprotein translocase subunit YajC [Candidatus Omnitrophica bacterium]|nr:preprotein translocase subunit YajC [Candidatus Omnitrophota bacterium]MDD5237622.1 preprotein translocase subunit YajC [Candidatus Omnitrophota bacterium]
MPQGQAVNPIVNLFPLFAIFIIFYFLLIRPQKTREKEHQKMLNNVKKNDEIVTNSGIHGTVVNVKDKTLILRIDDNVKIELEKNCVAYIKKPQGTATEGA